MHVISRRKLREFWEVHADSEQALTRWYKLASKAEWTSFAEMKAACPSADQVDHLIVVDIGGNKYRLVVEVFFSRSGRPCPSRVDPQGIRQRQVEGMRLWIKERFRTWRLVQRPVRRPRARA